MSCILSCSTQAGAVNTTLPFALIPISSHLRHADQASWTASPDPTPPPQGGHCVLEGGPHLIPEAPGGDLPRGRAAAPPAAIGLLVHGGAGGRGVASASTTGWNLNKQKTVDLCALLCDHSIVALLHKISTWIMRHCTTWRRPVFTRRAMAPLPLNPVTVDTRQACNEQQATSSFSRLIDETTNMRSLHFQAKGYQIGGTLANALLSVVQQLAACPVRDFLPRNTGGCCVRGTPLRAPAQRCSVCMCSAQRPAISAENVLPY